MKAQNPLVCIANIESNEVLRITMEQAIQFLQKSKSPWYFCEKRVYKQFIESKLGDGSVPAPEFQRVNKDGVSEIVNVYLGHPSFHINHKKSSDNKAGKHYYQHVASKLVNVTNKDKSVEKVLRPARTIKHVKRTTAEIQSTMSRN